MALIIPTIEDTEKCRKLYDEIIDEAEKIEGSKPKLGENGKITLEVMEHIVKRVSENPFMDAGAEAYHRKYGTLTAEDLNKMMTI